MNLISETQIFCSYMVLAYLSFLFSVEALNILVKSSNETFESSRIVNGEEASLGQFPWQVALRFTSDREGWTCGGIIISEEWILTTAHCLDYSLFGNVYAGGINLQDQNIVSSYVGRTIRHEDFQREGLLNDIGLLQVVELLVFNQNIQAIDLASDELKSGVDIVVSGWGQSSDDSGPTQILQYVTLSTIGNDECTKIYGNDIIYDGVVCAVSNSNVTKATCFGDSGGPAVVYNNGRPVLVALTSFISDRGCEIGDPSGFMRIDYYREWIREKCGV